MSNSFTLTKVKQISYTKFLKKLKLDENNDKVTTKLNSIISQSNVSKIELALAGFDEKLILQYVINKFAADVVNDLSFEELDDLLDSKDLTYHMCQYYREQVIDDLAHITKHNKFKS